MGRCLCSRWELQGEGQFLRRYVCACEGEGEMEVLRFGVIAGEVMILGLRR